MRSSSARYLILIPFAAIIGRLCYLQIYKQLHLLNKSIGNYLRHERTISPRGVITDYKGRLLATNRPLVQLQWRGTGNKQLSPEQQRDLEIIRTILQIPIDIQEIQQAERHSQLLSLSTPLSFEQLSTIIEQFPDHHNITFSTRFQRFYPYGASASHILGHIASLSHTHQAGSMGLEKACDSTLRGIPGQLIITVNSYGKQVTHHEIQHARSGDMITTTLDIELQQIAEECFPPDKAGVFIAMEAKSGALRVVLSQPSFDPNLFTQQITFADWERLLQTKALLNRAFFACYPPASLFKLVTIIAALDSKLIAPHETWYCIGFTTFHGRKYSCMRSKAHGSVTIEDALKDSCNMPFFDIGRHIKINTLAQYAHLLGLGIETDSIIGEKLGIIPSTQWKFATLHEPWWPGETLSAAIGQTYLQVPPIQICRMIGIICEGYAVTPHLIADTPPERVPSSINPTILARVKQSMSQVITRGTGSELSALNDDIKLFGKTGTAQTRNKTGNKELDEGAHSHGWFAFHMTHTGEPSLVVVILIEQVESSRDAIRVAKRFIKAYKKKVDKERAAI